MKKLKMTPNERKTFLEEHLTSTLTPEFLEVIDESHLHAGHAGAKSGASHFALKIRTEQLTGLSKVQQHQKIYQIVGHLIPKEIHALRIEIL